MESGHFACFRGPLRKLPATDAVVRIDCGSVEAVVQVVVEAAGSAHQCVAGGPVVRVDVAVDEEDDLGGEIRK